MKTMDALNPFFYVLVFDSSKMCFYVYHAILTHIILIHLNIRSQSEISSST